MTSFVTQQCGLDHYRFSLLLLMILLSFFYPLSVVQSQSADSVYKVTAQMTGEYVDVFRERSDQSATTIFARSFDATITASRRCDTLMFTYSGWNQYASHNSFTSDIALSAENGFRAVSLQWISSIGWLDYAGTLLFPFSHKFLPFHYSGWIRLKPYRNYFVPTFAYERMPAKFTSGLGLKDFLVPLDEHSTSSAWNITLQSQPVEFLDGMFSWGKTITNTQEKAGDFSSPLDWNTQTLSAQLKIHLNVHSCFWVGWKRSEDEGKAILNKDDLLFGDLAYGALTFDLWKVGGKTMIYSIPLSCEYSYRRWEGYGVGHIESWPFTPFAASVFANRLLYTFYGSVDAHQIAGRASVTWGNWHIEPALGFLYILTDVSMKHWEYDFFPFIVKSAKEELFSIQRCWLLRLACQVDFPFLGAKAAVQMEQFIPISVIRREEERSGVPTAPTVSSIPASTDGGRRIQLQVFFL